MNRYPEWFVNGPWHGKDKLRECPNSSGSIMVQQVEPQELNAYLNADEQPAMNITFRQFVYVPRHVDVFGELMQVWIPEEEAASLSNRNSDTTRLLGQLIMSPHRIDGGRRPFDVESQAQRHRHLWEIERDVRITVERQYRQRMDELERRLYSAESRAGHAQRDTLFRLDSRHTSGLIEIIDHNHERLFAQFGKVTLFFDEGNEEVPPSWVATAQGPPENGDHGKPYTGYGTSERAAIIALLADALDVDVRAVEIGERIR